MESRGRRQLRKLNSVENSWKFHLHSDGGSRTLRLCYETVLRQKWVRDTDSRRHFEVPPWGPIPDRNTILKWMRNVNTTWSFMKNKIKPLHKQCNEMQCVTSGNVWKHAFNWKDAIFLEVIFATWFYNILKIPSF